MAARKAAGRVVLVRHGETALNRGAGGKGESAERIRGWVDVDLDAEGKAEARRLGREFQKRPVAVVYCSPLSRARETAEQIADKAKAPLRPNISLLPWNLGVMHGELVNSIITAMNHYVEHPAECVPKGEPFDTYRVRFLDFLQRKLEEARGLPARSLVVCVTHSRGLQVTKAWMANGAPDDLSISTKRMLDYKDETGTGGMLVLTP
jgi:probable phosphoglycerate mutase